MLHRVRWSERHLTGIVHIIADYTADGWEFAQNDGYEIQWFPLSSTPELVAKARSELMTKARSLQQQARGYD
jgi:hypothetical protein